METQTSFGRVGTPVKILGSDLTGATGVSFNGTAATFTVVSSSLIEATVPAGATTGFVTVTMPRGTLKSNTRSVVGDAKNEISFVVAELGEERKLQ